MFDVLFFETTPGLFLLGFLIKTREPNDALPPDDFAAGFPAIFYLPIDVTKICNQLMKLIYFISFADLSAFAFCIHFLPIGL
jgi:hypothetical protein